MFLLIDNYDSFTYNLYHYLGELGAEMTVRRNDAITVDEALASDPEGFVISPGPCDPDRAGICLELVRRAAGRFPVFGVCLGCQAVGQAFGGRIIRAHVPMHGKLSSVEHEGSGLFEGIHAPFEATRYHSLIIERDSLPACLRITAETADGIIMGLEHKDHPIYGVQFHPESIASEFGHLILDNYLKLAKARSVAA